MTRFTTPRGQFRSVLASLLPHAGRATDDTPWFGRVRFAPDPDRVVAWTTDGLTAAAASAVIDLHEDGDLDRFDLPTSALKAALAVLTPPAGDARTSWDDSLLRVTMTGDHVHLLEVGDFMDGRAVEHPRLSADETAKNRYPDVPSFLGAALAGRAARWSPRLRPELAARFAVSARAWDSGTLRLVAVEDPNVVLVPLGERFVGYAHAWGEDDGSRERDTDARRGWVSTLRRHEHVDADLPPDVVEAARSLSRAGVTVTYHPGGA